MAGRGPHARASPLLTREPFRGMDAAAHKKARPGQDGRAGVKWRGQDSNL